MKERHGWGTLGLILTAFSLAEFLVSAENPLVIRFVTLYTALTVLFASGVIMLSVSCVGLIVDRL